MELSRYIHLNPVRAGMVQRPEEYQYSSYKTYTSRKKEEILTLDLILGMMSSQKGEEKKAYHLFVEAGIGKELDDPQRDVYGGIILGGARFTKESLRIVACQALTPLLLTLRYSPERQESAWHCY